MKLHGKVRSHTQRYTSSITWALPVFASAAYDRSMSWLKLGVRRGVPSIFSNRLKYCKVTLPSTVASPHFLDCVSSSAYTSIKTLFRDPVLGTHTVSIYKFDPPRRNNSCRTLDVLSCTIEYAIHDISYRMMPKR